MTATVFDNGMTAHVWANKSQPYGRSHNGNFYFDARSLYSYGTHYCVGYHLPGDSDVVLLNDDSSSVTTNGKHKPAAWSAVRHLDSHSVPGLTETARAIDSACMSYKGRELVARVAKHLESYSGAYWPGQDAAESIYRAMGARMADAKRRAKAGQMRVATAVEKARTAEEKRQLDSLAADAKRFAKYDTPESEARDARDKLAMAAGASHWQQESLEHEAAELGRDAFRAAKAAKAKGWTRIAAHCRAIHKAVRSEIKRYEDARARYALRAELRSNIESIRGASDQIKSFWTLNPLAHDGASVPGGDAQKAVGQCEAGAKGFRELAAALDHVLTSPYARHVWPGDTMHKARQNHHAATATAEKLAERAADNERDYQRAWGAGLRWAELADTVAETRAATLALLRENRESGGSRDLPAIHATFRDVTCKAWRTICEARAERAQLALDFGHCDGWSEGAGV